MITHEIQTLLDRPFTYEEHGFLNGNPYIRKNAIRNRLTEIDPQWCVTEPTLIQRDGDVVVMSGQLVLLGASRSGTGTGIIQSMKKEKDATGKETGKYIELVAFDLAREMSKAYKSAASDIVPRAALEYGIGAYLKNKPKEINQQSFKGWLEKLSGYRNGGNPGGNGGGGDPEEGLNLIRAEVKKLIGDTVSDSEICRYMAIDKFTVDAIKTKHAGKRPSELAKMVYDLWKDEVEKKKNPSGWTDFDTHTLDLLTSEYGLSSPEATIKLLHKGKWQDFPTPPAARAALKQLVAEMQTQLLVSKVTYRGQYTVLHCGDIEIRAYGRKHFRELETSHNAEFCETWKEGEAYTLPDAVSIKEKRWEHRAGADGGYYILKDNALQLAGIPF